MILLHRICQHLKPNILCNGCTQSISCNMWSLWMCSLHQLWKILHVDVYDNFSHPPANLPRYQSTWKHGFQNRTELEGRTVKTGNWDENRFFKPKEPDFLLISWTVKTGVGPQEPVITVQSNPLSNFKKKKKKKTT